MEKLSDIKKFGFKKKSKKKQLKICKEIVKKQKIAKTKSELIFTKRFNKHGKEIIFIKSVKGTYLVIFGLNYKTAIPRIIKLIKKIFYINNLKLQFKDLVFFYIY